MTALCAGQRRGWRIFALVLLAAAAFPAASGATPTYHGGASAGWGEQEGDVLTANPGSWTSTTDITYSYAWFNENSVRLGTGPTYTITGRDVGGQIYAAITATDGTPPPLIVNTPTVGPIRYRPPVNVEQPIVTGAALAGSTLVATPGRWVSGGASTAPIAISYFWYRGCTTGPQPDCRNAGYLGGGSSLVLSSADVGRPISLTVTASYPDGAGGQASNSAWVGNLGPVIASSIRSGDTLVGTVPWAITAPGVQTIAISVNETQLDVQQVGDDGVVVFALDTATLANGGHRLAVSLAWQDGTMRTVQIGTVTVSNGPLPPLTPVVTPSIAKPATTPARPVAGRRFVVTFTVTRSDNHRLLTRGRMTVVPSVSGRSIAHSESFVNGKARVVLTVPATARHRLLTVKVTIRLGNQSATRVATFRVR